MASWFAKIMADPNDLNLIFDAISYFEQELEDAKTEADNLVDRTKANTINDVSTRLPGLVGRRYDQLQEIDSIIDLIENREKRLIGEKRRHYAEHYNRTLSDTMIERYATTDPDVIDFADVKAYVVYIRNRYVALSRRHEYLHFQLTNVTKLRVANMEDAIL